MADVARLIVDDKEIELPVVVGSEQERAIDISVLRSTSGYITLDEGYGNTGSCRSAITYIDGEEGVLRYRGIPIEVLAEKSNFIETAYLLISGKLPTKDELSVFSSLLSEHAMLREQIRHQMTLFPPGSDLAVHNIFPSCVVRANSGAARSAAHSSGLKIRLRTQLLVPKCRSSASDSIGGQLQLPGTAPGGLRNVRWP